MPGQEINFRDRVYAVVELIPEGRVMTYGDIAAIAGQPRAARIVGQLAHFGDPALPWHRVVNRFGGLASGYYDGRVGQKRMLETEGVMIDEEFRVERFDTLKWIP